MSMFESTLASNVAENAFKAESKPKSFQQILLRLPALASNFEKVLTGNHVSLLLVDVQLLTWGEATGPFLYTHARRPFRAAELLSIEGRSQVVKQICLRNIHLSLVLVHCNHVSLPDQESHDETVDFLAGMRPSWVYTV